MDRCVAMCVDPVTPQLHGAQKCSGVWRLQRQRVPSTRTTAGRYASLCIASADRTRVIGQLMMVNRRGWFWSPGSGGNTCTLYVITDTCQPTIIILADQRFFLWYKPSINLLSIVPKQINRYSISLSCVLKCQYWLVIINKFG